MKRLALYLALATLALAFSGTGAAAGEYSPYVDRALGTAGGDQPDQGRQ